MPIKPRRWRLIVLLQRRDYGAVSSATPYADARHAGNAHRFELLLTLSILRHAGADRFALSAAIDYCLLSMFSPQRWCSAEKDGCATARRDVHCLVCAIVQTADMRPRHAGDFLLMA